MGKQKRVVPENAEKTAEKSSIVGVDLGARIRRVREGQRRSLRSLATALDISPSALSQIETGRSRPSVETLYAISTELGISLDRLFLPGGDPQPPIPNPTTSDSPGPSDPSIEISRSDAVQRFGDRKKISLQSGVTWERLNAVSDPDVEFLDVRYEVGGTSSGTGTFIRHDGREHGLVLSGVLRVTVGFDEHELGPGDSISFDSAVPHRLEAVGDKPVHAIWVVNARSRSQHAAPDSSGE